MADQDDNKISEGGIPRRRALKRVSQIVAAAAVGLTASGKVEASSSFGSRTGRTKTIRKVTLEATLANGKKLHFSVPENLPGTISHNGETFTIVPKASQTNKRLELAFHKGTQVTNRPAHVLDLGIGGSVTSAAIGNLPVTGFAAFWAGNSTVPEDYTPDADCTCYCNCPPYLTLIGCACCCDPDDPWCGFCFTPPCGDNCGDPPPGDQ